MKIIQLNDCSLFIAETIWDKTRGVIGKESLLENGFLLIPNCNWVHGFFLQKSLHIYFLSTDWQIVLGAEELKPNNLSRLCWRARHTLEAPMHASSVKLQEVLLYLRRNKI